MDENSKDFIKYFDVELKNEKGIHKIYIYDENGDITSDFVVLTEKVKSATITVNKNETKAGFVVRYEPLDEE